MTAPLPVREYASAEEMRARYAALHRATFPPQPVAVPEIIFDAPPPADEPAPIPSPDIEVTRAAYIAAREEYLMKRRIVGAVEKPMADCLRIVWAVTGVKTADIRGRSKLPDFVKARQIASFLMVRIEKRSLPEVGRFLGGRDHTTALWGCRRADLAVSTHGITDLSDPIEVAQRLWDVKWPRLTRAMLKAAS